MKNRLTQSSGSNQLRWVILLLAVAVILPTVCLLWFTTKAVKNERLVIRQKLINFYTKKTPQLFNELPGLYQDIYKKSAGISSLRDSSHTFLRGSLSTLALLFAADPNYRYQTMLIYCTSRNFILYPTFDIFIKKHPDELIEPFQQELKGNLEDAIKQYETVAEQTDSEIVRFKAMLSKTRCLEKLGKNQKAVQLAYELSFPSDTNNIKFELASAVMHSQVFLAQLYHKTNNENLLPHLQEILGDSHYSNGNKTFFPTETILWQLDKLINIAQQAGLTDKLQPEIESAKNRIDECHKAILAAYIYPNADSLSGWPDQTIRKLSPETDFYGFKRKLEDDDESFSLYVSNGDRILRTINAAVSNIQDDTIGVKVYNNFNQLIAGDNNLTVKSFLTVRPAKFLPDFKVEVYFRNDTVFENAANKQATIYIWTAILVILLILASGGLATQALTHQIKLNRLKNDFIATVTHELKTPLSSMRVLVDTLLEGNYNDQKQATEYLQLISKENLRLSRLIDNFLTFSRMERNKQVFDIVKTNPAEIAEQAAEAVRTKFRKGNCKFEVKIADDLPNVSADKDAMVTVLVNLLDNAYKYSSDNKQIELKVFAQENKVCFSVKDNGIGMTRRQTKRVFDRFYQADNSLSRQAEGTGLGLSIVKFIIGAHKGQITVESKPGKGSEFTVKLLIQIAGQ